MRRTPEVSLMIISWSWFEGFETEQLLRSRHRLITESSSASFMRPAAGQVCRMEVAVGPF